MSDPLCFTIAGCALELRPEGGLEVPPPPDAFSAFRGATEGERMTLHLAAGEPPQPKGECLFASLPVWSLHRAGGGMLFEMLAHHPPRRRSLFVARRRGLRRLWFQGADRDPFAGPALELLFVLHLAEHGGLLLHGCGFARGGRGLLFLGESGAGKSTIARLLAREGAGEIVSDDRVILRRDGRGGFLLYGTPWHGEARFAARGGVPLAAAFLLRHGREHRKIPLSRPAAVSGLLQCSFPPLWDRGAMAETLRRFDELAGRVPFFALEFLPDRGVLELLAEAPRR